jgi:hypothetical protein
MPSSLDWLLNRLTRLIAAATDALEASYPDGVQAWQAEIARQLARYHAAAMLAGAGVDTLTKPMTAAVTQDIATQLGFLSKFGVEIQDGQQWERGYNARAEMYAGAIKAPFYQAFTGMLPLPAMPGDGTSQCLTRCGCQWEIDALAGEGNADAYWRRAKDDGCATCMQREADWSPVQIRDGVLQL